MAETKTTAHTEVPGGAHKAAFPPFQKDTFAAQLFWLALSFVVLYWLMAKVALPGIAAIFKQRRERIAADLGQAERLRSESDAALAAYEKALADARARAQAIAADTHARLAAESETRRRALEAELNDKLAAAEKSIAATRTAAMTNVRGIAADAAAAIVERLTGAAPPPPAVQAAVDDALKR